MGTSMTSVVCRKLRHKSPKVLATTRATSCVRPRGAVWIPTTSWRLSSQKIAGQFTQNFGHNESSTSPSLSDHAEKLQHSKSMAPGGSRNQTGRSPESNRAIPGIKPGAPRNQTGGCPESSFHRGTLSQGPGSRNLACGGRLWVLARRSSGVEGVARLF